MNRWKYQNKKPQQTPQKQLKQAPAQPVYRPPYDPAANCNKRKNKRQTSSTTPVHQRCPPTPVDPTGTNRPKENHKPKSRGKHKQTKEDKTGGSTTTCPTNTFQGPGPTGGTYVHSASFTEPKETKPDRQKCPTTSGDRSNPHNHRHYPARQYPTGPTQPKKLKVSKEHNNHCKKPSV